MIPWLLAGGALAAALMVGAFQLELLLSTYLSDLQPFTVVSITGWFSVADQDRRSDVLLRALRRSGRSAVSSASPAWPTISRTSRRVPSRPAASAESNNGIPTVSDWWWIPCSPSSGRSQAGQWVAFRPPRLLRPTTAILTATATATVRACTEVTGASTIPAVNAVGDIRSVLAVTLGGQGGLRR
jgi:hypothetical protein